MTTNDMSRYVLGFAQTVRYGWGSIREPRHIKTAFLVYYLASVGVSVAVAVAPPAVVENILGFWLTLGFSLLLLVGGAAAAVAVYPGWWWVERLGNWFQIGALAICVVMAMPSGPILPILLFIATGVFVIRLLMIRKYSYEPRG